MKTHDEFPGSISLPFGIKTSHTWHEIGQILRIVNDLSVETFVELGVHVGGLASILSLIPNYRDFRYYGLEIDLSLVDPRVSRYVYGLDVFSGQAVELIRRNSVNKTLIYCDGGNKIEEMRTYHSIIKSGDIIMCHDYFEGQEVTGLAGFGNDDGACGCKPEVSSENLLFFDDDFDVLPKYLLDGTRIMGFIKK